MARRRKSQSKVNKANEPAKNTANKTDEDDEYEQYWNGFMWERRKKKKDK